MSLRWVRAGERKDVPSENPARRRYNTRALDAPDGVQPAFDGIGSPRAFTGPDLVDFLRERPPCPVPLGIGLDKARLHPSRGVQEVLPRRWARRIYCSFLPPYSPELNESEAVFRVSKHWDLPERVYTPLAALEAAVDGAYSRCEEKLLPQASHQLRPAA